MNRVRTSMAGISGVHVTAYRDNGDVDLDLTKKVVSRIAAAGVHNIVSAGNTGEFFSLTFDEVVRVQAAAAEANAGRSLLTASVGRSLREAIETGRQAKRSGADAIMVHHPRDPFAGPSAQADYFIAVADALELPVMAYVRSESLGNDDLIRMATHENIVGVKYAATNLMRFAEVVRLTTDVDVAWVCGLAEGWAPPFYALGARGFTSGLVNVAPGLSLAVWNALEAGDYAAARRHISALDGFERMRTLAENGTNVTVVKEAMSMQGLRVGPVRLPGVPELDDRNRKLLAEIVGSWSPELLAA